jgi:hypothetical protein
MGLHTFEAYLENIQQDNRPHTGELLIPHFRQPPFKAWLVPLDNAPRAEESHNARTGLKGAEHDGHSAVLKDVRDGLDPGPGGIDVGAEIGVEDAEGRRG